MSIKRVLDLPNIAVQIYGTDTNIRGLSNCYLEASHPKTNGYESVKVDGYKIFEKTYSEINNTTVLGKVAISEGLSVMGAILNMVSSNMILEDGSNIFSWPNIDPNGKDTSCYLQFDDVKIYGRKDLELSSGGPFNIYAGTEPIEYPVVINDNLSVYRYLTKTVNEVSLENSENNIIVPTKPTNSSYLDSNRNILINCQMLHQMLGHSIPF